LLATALLFGLSLLAPGGWKGRLALALAAGLAVAAFHALVWPHCLSRLEGVSPEVEQLWLSHVREARPVYRHGWKLAVAIVSIPVTGIIGWTLLAWVRRRDPAQLRRILAAATPALAATLLLLWQTRTGPAAQLMGVVGAAALTWIAVPWAQRSKRAVVRVCGTVLIAVVGFGAAAPVASTFYPAENKSTRMKAVDRANGSCPSLAALRAVAQQPKGMVFTFVDLGPRLITVTHHDAVTGPYHRNGEQIADVMNAFRGSERQAHQIIVKYRSDYVLVCPNMSTATIFMAETPKGFYAQIMKGRVPDWLEPVKLPRNSPFRMWRVKR
jgi:hypothetical protein